MKTFSRTVTAVCLMFIAVFAASQLAGTDPTQTTVFNPRSDGMYHVADAPGANFDEKLAACFAASDAANLTMSNVKLWNFGSLGEKLTTGWMEMNCTEPTQRPVVNLTNVLVGNGTGDKSLPIALRPVVKAGTWKKSSGRNGLDWRAQGHSTVK